MLIISKGKVSVHDKTLFTHNRLVISCNKIIGIVGRNGVGKTTFLKQIVSIVKNSGETFAYVEQLPEITDPISGGEKVKKSLLKAFNSSSDILILDEPSANLDEEQCNWLMDKMRLFTGIILVVSHNVDILNLTDEIWAINSEKLRVYPGDYDVYIKQRNKEEEKQDRTYKSQQRQIKHLRQEAIKRRQRAYRLKTGNGKKMTNSEKKAAGRTSHDGMERKMQAGAKAIENRIAHMNLVDKVITEKPIKFVEPNEKFYLKKTVLNIFNQNIAIDGRLLIKNVSFKLKYGDRLWLRGNNGTGKTTLVSTILKAKDEFIPKEINTGYFNQELNQITLDKSIWNNVSENSSQTNQVIHAVLGGLMLKNINQLAKELSGGQLVRLQLAKVLLGDNQLLFLDEPTNYLDLNTKDALKNFLKNYPGTILLISHDREFAKSVISKELVIKNKQLLDPNYLVKYSDSNYGELLRLKFQLDQLINDPSANFSDIKRLEEKIRHINKNN